MLSEFGADGTFGQIDFYDFKSHADLGSPMGGGSSSWGWTSPDGREFVAVAQRDGAAFAEINKEGKLVYLGRLPQYTTAQPSLWRELRGYKNYIVIGELQVRCHSSWSTVLKHDGRFRGREARCPDLRHGKAP